jgi:hypothetical protein
MVQPVGGTFTDPVDGTEYRLTPYGQMVFDLDGWEVSANIEH